MSSVSRAHASQPVEYSSIAWTAQEAATTQSVHSLVWRVGMLACARRGDSAQATRAVVSAQRVPLPKPPRCPNGIARMFQTLDDHPLVSVEIFHDVTEALAWVEDAA
jgi:hypothetical protein